MQILITGFYPFLLAGLEKCELKPRAEEQAGTFEKRTQNSPQENIQSCKGELLPINRMNSLT